ncbi:MAG: hypothetical protein ABJA71_01585 [Ginsengibacter sp.]
MKHLKICLPFGVLFIFAIAISQIKKPSLPPPPEKQMNKPPETQKVIQSKLNHPPLPSEPPTPLPPPPEIQMNKLTEPQKAIIPKLSVPPVPPEPPIPAPPPPPLPPKENVLKIKALRDFEGLIKLKFVNFILRSFRHTHSYGLHWDC